jgi:hypothetical protein
VGGAHYNKWDEIWELGDFNSLGQEYPDNTRIRAKDYVPVVGGSTYYFCSPNNASFYFYDSNKDHVDGNRSVTGNSTFTAPSNASYLRFSIVSAYGTTYNNDIAINYPSSVTTYSPYSNLCPIHGTDEVGVDVCGFNLFDNNTFVKGRLDSGIVGYADNTTEMTITDSGVDFTTNANYRGVVGGFIKVKPNTDYYLTYTYNGSITVTRSVDFYDKGGNWLYRMTPFTNPFTTPSDCQYIRIAFQLNSSGSASITDICVNISTPTGNPKDGDYVPFNGNSETLSLPTTVYGGTVDVTGGSGSVTYGYIDLGSLTWYTGPTSGTFYSETLPYPARNPQSSTEISNSKCTCYEIIDAQTWYYGRKTGATITGVGYGAAGRIGIFDETQTAATREQFKSYVSGQYIAYPLATPSTLSTTPTPINMLEGVNNVWSECSEDGAVVGDAEQSLIYQPQNIVGELRQEINGKIDKGWHDSFANLTDTAFSNLANGQILKWNSTTNKWENANESGGGGLPAWTKIWNYKSGATFTMPSGKTDIMLVIVSTLVATRLTSAFYPVEYPFSYILAVEYTLADGAVGLDINTSNAAHPWIDSSQYSLSDFDFEIWVR